MEFSCEHCNTNICIDPDQVNADMVCPACGEPVEVPEFPKELIEAMDRSLAVESEGKSNGEGDHKAAEAMLEQPASRETTVWREKLAASFQAANRSNVAQADIEEFKGRKKSFFESHVDSLLEYFSIRNVDSFDEYCRTLSQIGGIFILVFGVLALVHCIVLTSKMNDAIYFIFGLAGLVVSFCLCYLASKFSGTGGELIRSSDLVFYTKEMHLAFGLLSAAATFALLLLGGYICIRHRSLTLAVSYLIPAIGTAHAALLFVSPEVLNTRISQNYASAGETGLSLIGFVIRVLMMLSGILLAAVPVLSVYLLYIIFDSLGAGRPARIREFSILCLSVALVASAPMITYLIYLLFRIFLDFYRAVFGMSAGMDIFLHSLSAKED
ncbi:MAG: hypothetical protein JW808_00335 [Victivallales bacterium]|nr:hypothetical protein [Victivallales bacterium]